MVPQFLDCGHAYGFQAKMRIF